VSESNFTRSSEIIWENYYKAIEGRPLRPLFLEALPLLPDPGADERPPVALDLGCGDGSETLALLARGWTVVAVDAAPEAILRLRASVQPTDSDRLTTVVGAFHEVDFPGADFVYAGLSLPFCIPESFTDVWRAVGEALSGGGVFAGHFFGPHDSWASTPDMTFHTREELEGLLTEFDVHVLMEQDEDGSAVSGPKHWHVFHVIATRRRPVSAPRADRGARPTAG
jgi:SAM-dependent methyltransferase